MPLGGGTGLGRKPCRGGAAGAAAVRQAAELSEHPSSTRRDGEGASSRPRGARIDGEGGAVDGFSARTGPPGARTRPRSTRSDLRGAALRPRPFCSRPLWGALHPRRGRYLPSQGEDHPSRGRERTRRGRDGPQRGKVPSPSRARPSPPGMGPSPSRARRENQGMLRAPKRARGALLGDGTIPARDGTFPKRGLKRTVESPCGWSGIRQLPPLTPLARKNASSGGSRLFRSDTLYRLGAHFPSRATKLQEVATLLLTSGVSCSDNHVVDRTVLESSQPASPSAN